MEQSAGGWDLIPVPREGFEPSRPFGAADFKSAASVQFRHPGWGAQKLAAVPAPRQC